MNYVILVKPNNNIPYFEEFKIMCIEETRILMNRLGLAYNDLEIVQIGKANYLRFSLESKLDTHHIKHFQQLSYYYTIFEVTEDDHFIPLNWPATHYLGEDVSTRLKYNGKTNEVFTRLMTNLAIFSTEYYDLETINLFDPVCGKGTTLFDALTLGYHAYGTEQNKSSVAELNQYLIRYLKEGKYKHSAKKGKASGSKKNLGEMVEIQLAKSKEEMKTGTTKTLKVLRGDTADSHHFFKKNSMHIIVGDLPYGVQHIGRNKEANVRGLAKLLDNALDSWSLLLKKGGAVALSWNTYTNKKSEFKEIFESKGFKVMDSEPYTKFHHRVSQAINRDIIIAVKQ